MAIITIDERLDAETLSFLKSFRDIEEAKLVSM